MGKTPPLFLHYAGCTTCKKALAWLRGKNIEPVLRPIVEQGPSAAELHKWIPQSGLPLKKWLNTSGLSYRTLGKEKIDAMSEAQLVKQLASDGKLVKRPVLVVGDRVLVGFDEKAYAATFDD